MGRWYLMRVKKGNEWKSIGGTKELVGEGNLARIHEGVGMKVEGDLTITIPEGKTGVQRMFQGWRIEKLPKFEGLENVSTLGYMFEGSTLVGVDFTGMPTGRATNMNRFLDKVNAPEGIDLTGLDMTSAGMNSGLFNEINTPWIKIPKLEGDVGSMLQSSVLSAGVEVEGRDNIVIKCHHSDIDNMRTTMDMYVGFGIITEGYRILEEYFYESELVPYIINLQDSNGNPIVGQTFELLRDGEVYRVATSDEDGQVDFGKVPPKGSYVPRQVR